MAVLGKPTHVDGVSWLDAPIPHRWHRCKPQTVGWIGSEHDPLRLERCACGSTRLGGDGPWMERNSRTKKTGAE